MGFSASYLGVIRFIQKAADAVTVDMLREGFDSQGIVLFDAGHC